MQTPDDIQQAIARLPAIQREQLLTWLSDVIDADGVEEAAPSYRSDSDPRHFSLQEYFAFEEASPLRHEYVNGVIYAMAGASENHELISGNLFATIHAHLRGSDCTSYKGDFRVQLQFARNEIVYYPDIMVSCTRDGVEKAFLRYPTLIVEVLSPSTRQIDQREKRLSYTQIQTLQEYLIIAQDKPEIVLHERTNDWMPRRISGLQSRVELASINLSLCLDQVFEKATLRN